MTYILTQAYHVLHIFVAKFIYLYSVVVAGGGVLCEHLGERKKVKFILSFVMR